MFNQDVMEYTDNKVVFDCHNPNTKYDLGYIIDTEGKKENKIFTDGDVTVLYEDDSFKSVKVDNATYAIQAAYVNNELVSGELKAMHVSPVFLAFLMFELRDFYRGMHSSYEESNNKPKVLRKKFN